MIDALLGADTSLQLFNHPDQHTKRVIAYFAIIFSGAFLFFLIGVKPQLIYQHQQPVFFTGNDYLQKHLAYPGGIADYLSDFVSQFYIYPLLGAFLIVLILAAITFLAHNIFRVFNRGKSVTVPTIVVAVLLIGMQSGYFYRLAHSFAILFPLIFFFLYERIQKLHYGIRTLSYVILTILLYYLVAAPFLIFVFLALVSELLMSKERWRVKVPLVLLYGLVALAWPQIAHQFLFLFSKPAIYTYLLPFEIFMPIKVLPELLYVVLLSVPLFFALFNLFVKANSADDSIKKQYKFWRVAAIAFMLIALCVTAFYSLDKKHRVILEIDRRAESQEWGDIIHLAQKHSDVNHRLITLHYNRALFHTDQLCDNLFDYPQIEGEKGLYRTSGPAFEMPFALAALTYEMGNLNAAQTWANEALSIEGESARVLKLLALVHSKKSEYAAVRLYLNKLSETLFNRRWATNLMDATGEQNTGKSKSQPADSSRYLFRFGFPYGELLSWWRANPENKMAFEYCIAYLLLARRMDQFIEFIPQFSTRRPENMGRHVEEALILAGMSGATKDIDMTSLQILKSNVDRFQEFMSIIHKHNNNTQNAQAELAESFADTYWYYHLYHQPQELKR